MVFKLHGVLQSTCTLRVRIAAAEAGVELEFIPVDFKAGEHKSPEYLKLQPFGQVPVLEDTENGLTFFESRAIARYIATKAGASHLIPLGSEPDYLIKLAKFENAASIEYCNFDPSASGIAKEAIFKPMFGGESDPVAIKNYAELLSGKLDAYEKILSTQPYLAGDSLTLADLFHIPYGRLLFAAGKGDLIESRPSVAAWWKKLLARKAVKKIIDN